MGICQFCFYYIMRFAHSMHSAKSASLQANNFAFIILRINYHLIGYYFTNHFPENQAV